MTAKTASQQGAASRRKGASAEREAIRLLAAHGIVARRSASMQAARIRSGVKVPDLICEAPHDYLWIEVKATKAPSAVWEGLAQAQQGLDGADRDGVPLVLYKAPRKPWVAAVPNGCADVGDFHAVVPAGSMAEAVRLTHGALAAATFPMVDVIAKAHPRVYVGPAVVVIASLTRL